MRHDAALIVLQVKGKPEGASLANLDAILATEGLDGVYVGPSDLTLSLGLGANGDSSDPKFIDTLSYVVERSRAAGRHIGMHCANGPQARRMVEMGFDFVTVGSDTGLMTEAGRARLALVREHAPGNRKGEGY